MNEFNSKDEFDAFDNFLYAKNSIGTLNSGVCFRISLESFLYEICARQGYNIIHIRKSAHSLGDLINFLCKDKCFIPKDIWNRSFKSNDDNFLHEIRIMGNDATHNKIIPNDKDIRDLLILFETRFINWYVNAYKIKNWQDSHSSNKEKYRPLNASELVQENRKNLREHTDELTKIKNQLKETLDHIQESNQAIDNLKKSVGDISENFENQTKHLIKASGNFEENAMLINKVLISLENITNSKESDDQIKNIAGQIKSLKLQYVDLSELIKETSQKKENEKYAGISKEESDKLNNEIQDHKATINKFNKIINEIDDRFTKIVTPPTVKIETEKESKINNKRLLWIFIPVIFVIILGVIFYQDHDQPIVVHPPPNEEILRNELLKIIDTKKTRDERQEIAARVWEEYFYPEVYVDNLTDSMDKNPEHWSPGNGQNYLVHLITLPSIIDIKILSVERDKETQKISGLRVCEIHNGSKSDP